MSDTIYCYPDSDVLINKLDIRELDKLHTFERKLTMLRLLELMDKPISGKFDFKHLQAIHRYIFQDVYDWAGKVRTVEKMAHEPHGCLIMQLAHKKNRKRLPRMSSQQLSLGLRTNREEICSPTSSIPKCPTRYGAL